MLLCARVWGPACALLAGRRPRGHPGAYCLHGASAHCQARRTLAAATWYINTPHRALLESIAFQSRDVLDAMRKDAGGGLDLHVLRVDGGASVNNLLLQVQADLLQVPVERPTHLETTSLGAALAAGVAVGVYDPATLLTAPLGDDVSRFAPLVSIHEAQRRYRCDRSTLLLCDTLCCVCPGVGTRQWNAVWTSQICTVYSKIDIVKFFSSKLPHC